MIGIAYFLILWLGVGFLTGFKALFVDQVYDEEFKQELIDSFSPGIMVFYILIGLLPLAIKIAGLLKRS
ncbi:hypothetical protein ACN9L9_10235 [Bacillus velezensis]|uniref:hypothetical protein n=1 Tax=Bacillus TaxID=1386 RepID=UPI000F01818A|nr:MULTISPECIES: hypothetical protein [Bacillus amyloliquefaciens group]AZJ44328.1 hypothetical protein EG882_14025 [Bacillus velezensis]MDK4254945.1 hypothetical protein [Bacillus velezensis]MEC2353957.1 hypothetical protein [Bacillus velezensis]MED3400505.1 hypothetical protein [Bacillus velezensis]NUI22271.1 hypothetical protein [Bacillus amyloliquefaciens]